MVRRALRLLLEAQDDFEVVGESMNVAGTLDAVDRLRPDVVVCDLMMPDGTMLPQLDRLADAGCAIVVLTMVADPGYERATLRAGASAFLLKDATPDELIAAIRDARPRPRPVAAA